MGIYSTSKEHSFFSLCIRMTGAARGVSLDARLPLTASVTRPDTPKSGTRGVLMMVGADTSRLKRAQQTLEPAEDP